VTAAEPSASAGERLSGAQLKELSVIDPWRVGRAIATSWAVLAVAVAAAVAASHWAVVLAAALVVANRQYALLLLVHEASHFLFSRDRARNDRVANWTCAYPIGITVERYREVHLEHHRHLGTADDPDFDYYRGALTPGGLARKVVAGALGLKGLATILFYFVPRAAERWHPSLRGRPAARASSPVSLAGVAAAQVALLAAFALAGRPLLYAVVWLAPLLTLVPLANQLRTLAEHASLDGAPVTRTVLTGVVGRVLLAPVLFFYHYEHHLHPSVPFYRLPELHRRLRESGRYDPPAAVLAPSYTRTLAALSRGEVPAPRRGGARMGLARTAARD
jgi:fatty acid desaturase